MRKLIAEVYATKRVADDVDLREGTPIAPMDLFVVEHFFNKFGQRSIVQDRLRRLMASLIRYSGLAAHREDASTEWCRTFARFVGIVPETGLGASALAAMVSAVGAAEDAANIAYTLKTGRGHLHFVEAAEAGAIVRVLVGPLKHASAIEAVEALAGFEAAVEIAGTAGTTRAAVPIDAIAKVFIDAYLANEAAISARLEAAFDLVAPGGDASGKQSEAALNRVAKAVVHADAPKPAGAVVDVAEATSKKGFVEAVLKLSRKQTVLALLKALPSVGGGGGGASREAAAGSPEEVLLRKVAEAYGLDHREVVARFGVA